MNRNLRDRLVTTAFLLILAAVALFLSHPAKLHAQQKASAPQAAPAGDVENGKKLFNKDGCYQCHGYGGQGGAAGARLNGNPITYSAFVTYIRAPKGQMPPYTAKVVSDKELADIYAFIHSLPKPPDPKSIPMLNE